MCGNCHKSHNIITQRMQNNILAQFLKKNIRLINWLLTIEQNICESILLLKIAKIKVIGLRTAP